MAPPTLVLLSAIAFLFTLVFGFWLRRAGKPYHSVLFNLHKLSALVAVVLSAIRIYGMVNATQVESLAILLIVVAGVGVVALFVTGAFMSAEKFDYALMRNIHRTALGLVLVALGGTVFVLSGMQM